MWALGPTDEITAELVRSNLQHWLGSRLPGTVAAFLAMGHEVDLTALFRTLPGWNWVLPRVEEDGRLTFRDRDVPRETHRFGMEQPVAKGTITRLELIDVFLVPGLAFDPSGGRLGHGGGFYDRVLSRRRGDCVAIGVTTVSRLVESVPLEAHDQRVDKVATENEIIDCQTRRRSDRS